MSYTVSRIASAKDGIDGLLEVPGHPGLQPRVFVLKDGDIEHCDPDTFHREGARARTFFCGVERADSFTFVGE